VRQWQSDLSQIQECNKPVIAATHGRCIGGGVDLVTGTRTHQRTRVVTVDG
jgi:enoyl-CoA hydratase/carnithine racemase